MSKKILIVDDDPEAVQIIGTKLKTNGYQVVSVLDGKKALEKARAEKPDLIILDIMMPEIDGAEISAAIKEDNGTRDIPVFYLTNLITKKEERQLGPNVVVSKMDIELLLKRIKETGV